MNAAMLRSRDNFQFQLFMESDFGGVIAVDRHFLEDGEEIVLHLEIAALGLPNRRASYAVQARPDHGGGFIEGTQKGKLLIRRSVREIFAEERAALLVHIGEAAEEIAALFVIGPFGKDDVNEFVDKRALGARRLGGGYNLVNHGDDRIILMGVESAQFVVGARVRIAEESKKFGRQRRQDAASQKQF